jgi:hypothetical protein
MATQATKSELPFASESKSSSLAASEQTSSTSTANGVGGDNAPTTTKSEAELAADKLYEERIEEEYAKREGGA